MGLWISLSSERICTFGKLRQQYSLRHCPLSVRWERKGLPPCRPELAVLICLSAFPAVAVSKPDVHTEPRELIVLARLKAHLKGFSLLNFFFFVKYTPQTKKGHKTYT